jgi:glycyl-tRNA synthetase alpha subunit
MSEESLRMARANQAEQALTQFLAPAFDVVRTDYMEKLASIAAKPLTNDMRAGMEKLALAVKVVDEVRAQVTALVADGQVAQSDLRRASNIAELPSEKRRWALY